MRPISSQRVDPRLWSEREQADTEKEVRSGKGALMESEFLS